IRVFHVTGVQTCALPILMHSLVQDRHYTDVAIGEPAPVDVVPLVPEDEPLDPELRRNRLRRHVAGYDAGKSIEHAGKVSIRLSKIGRASCRERAWARGVA